MKLYFFDETSYLHKFEFFNFQLMISFVSVYSYLPDLLVYLSDKDKRELLDTLIWFHFKEGFSNAVRRSVKVQDLL